jgi:hypothetical protein
MTLPKLNSQHKFFLLSGLLFLIIFIVEHLNHRFWLNDFKVYFMAAEAFLNGKQVYGVPFGLDTGYYKYSPFFLILFAPYTLLAYPIAASMHFFLIALAFMLIVKMLEKILFYFGLYKDNQYSFLLLFAVLLGGISHLVRELHLGNMNAILLCLLVAALLNVLESRPLPAGMLLGLAVLCKPYFCILFLPLLLHKKVSAVIISVFFVGFACLLPAIFTGLSKDIDLHLDWIRAMLAHDTYQESFHTILSLGRTYIQPQLPKHIHYILASSLFLAYMVYFLYNNKARLLLEDDGATQKRNMVLQYFLILAIIPNVITTDTEHFLFSLPLVGLLVFYLQKFRNAALTGALIVILIFYGCNSTDFFGRKLSGQFEVLGLTGISNLMLILLAAGLFSAGNYSGRLSDGSERVQ